MRSMIIVNPTSGRGSGGNAIPRIKELLDDTGLDFSLVCTEYPWHAAEITQKAVADGFDVVVSAGGDGTANEVINGLMLAKESGIGTAAMGVLAVGRGNDFAYSMGIPTTLEACCQVLVKNYRRTIDVGKMKGGLYPDGRYFGNGLGIGFDAVVGFEALKLKRLHGFASYIVAALKTIFLYFKAPTVRITLDEGDEMILPALMVSTMNGIRLGGGFMMAPEGDPEDGLFDVCIARQVSRPQMFVLIQKFMAGTQESHDAIQIIRSTKVNVTALEGVLPAHGDGETISLEGNEINIDLIPGQLELISTAPI